MSGRIYFKICMYKKVRSIFDTLFKDEVKLRKSHSFEGKFKIQTESF
ncbi:hypothetical protein LEP1GSC127_4689 [Leptospira kirschneri str. 200801925]|nr:hypothetical protein LEP1GSC044_3843 [Leptospira kirschneri serovar Grippotyphosa str. RM52]EKP04475.1 hypothetical protein LEP1GSC018_0200 [Leptospira kirschneri str. 2008720114]EKQ83629.1 hypothetical protein LEP1GSC064_0923 [Leptospira kirschneri serovar Grippotyphosa str. Moskva]EKR08533.1 hypothetical protein LEP1GSC122_1395 [Leptospira kirschneri serovar Valbuzzi str. 200702274]EMK14081.1 hypothetical protein LEP1GSC042_2956 [Leptospira kirschneri serovar Bim str. PUO 1247]EMN03652.1 